MKMKNWFSRWTIAIIAIISSMTLFSVFTIRQVFIQNQQLEPVTINSARVLTSNVLGLVEDKLSDGKVSEDERILLTKAVRSSNIELVYLALDGTVLYHSEDKEQKVRLNLRYDLHYEIYEKDQAAYYKITFPVLNMADIQIGNAIFFIPERLLVHKNYDYTIWQIGILAGMLFVSGLLLFIHNRKLSESYNRPLYNMMLRMKSILRDDFNTVSIKDNPPIDPEEVQAVFEQMCLHIEMIARTSRQKETAQKELISNISHDIRTPLATLNAYVDAILDGACPDMPSVMRYVGVIHNHSRKMVQLVNDLFYHSLQQLGQIKVTPTAQYSEPIFRHINNSLKQMAETKNIRWREPENIPDILIKVDAERLEQVMDNLVQNAIKHTSSGGLIHLDIELDKDMLKVSVADNGEGISPEDIPYVFDRYYQGHFKKEKKNEGSGLGLAICKNIIEQHGGEIFFKTVKGQGTTFSFTLPVC